MNVLLILADKLRQDALFSYGNKIIKTPNIDSLANDGILFKNACCTTPKCAPSRASILSGLYPKTSGFKTNEMSFDKNTIMISDFLKEDGYRTGYFGKWHLGDEIIPARNYDEWISTEDKFVSQYSRPEYALLRSDYHHFLETNGFVPDEGSDIGAFFSRGFATRVPERFSKPAFLASHAIRFIEDNKDSRFFLTLSFLEPHAPFNSVFDDMYDPADITLRDAYYHQSRGNEPLKCFYDREYTKKHGIGNPLADEGDWKKFMARYYGAISLVDKYIGNVIDTLIELGLYEDTLMIFTSDHGGMLGDFGMLKEDTLYNGCMKVPLIIKIPGIKKGQIINDHVSQIDIMPTVLDVTGIENNAHLDGKSLMRFIFRERKSDDEPVILESTGKSAFDNAIFKDHMNDDDKKDLILKLYKKEVTDRAVIYKGWKYILSGANENELYDLINDPAETDNLYGNTKYTKTQSMLSDILNRSFGL